jgi:formylglycine-generating enzyme required for sulfatase activity
LLLQPPTLEHAEYWLASRPRNAPEPTKEVRVYVVESRKRMRASQRLRRLAQTSIFTLLVGIILGLLGWINQNYLEAQWRWWTVSRPFIAENIWPYVLTPTTERAFKPDPNISFRECAPMQPSKDFCPDMIVIPAGMFSMGSPNPTAAVVLLSEEPQHVVKFSKSFAVSKFELTFDQWDTCVTYGDCIIGVSDGGFGRGNQPVINVTWDDAKRYVAWLSKMTGQPYRLLTEAEYEYATRAGTQTAYPWGDEIVVGNKVMASCNGCDGKMQIQTASVGSFGPNGFGLYDMVGNVWEWVEDCEHKNYIGAPTDGSAWTDGGNCHMRVARGGSWIDAPDKLRSANRDSGAADDRANFLGFRIARTLDTR